MTINFNYGTTAIKDIQIDQKGGATIHGCTFTTSKRFWHSLRLLFKFNDKIFKYFTHKEVFDRIHDTCPRASVRYCSETHSESVPCLLGLSNPGKAIVEYPLLEDVLQDYSTDKVDYSSGIVRSSHVPNVPWTFNVGGDIFSSRFILDTPIDGFGKPSLYISLLRQICSNGNIGYSPAFRTYLNLGKEKIESSLRRVLSSYNNEDGYSALSSRFDSATRSWASVAEVMKIHNTLIKVHGSKNLKKVRTFAVGESSDLEESTGVPVSIMRQFSKLTGDLNKEYGLSNIDVLSEKKKRVLPAPCKVYDLLNFTSEVATHHATPQGARMLQASLGSLVSKEYDLEGTVNDYDDWKDFFIHDSSAAAVKQDLN
jgi:hypothetical protein